MTSRTPSPTSVTTEATETTGTTARVTVVGLGPMGTALARAFLDAGHATTVWNRTPERAAALTGAGALAADDVAAAVAGADLVVVCVRDQEVSRAVLRGAGGALDGRDVLVLSSGTPEGARETAAELTAAGARPLSGAVMVPTPLVGTPDGWVLLSGPGALVNRHAATLGALGHVEHVGEEPGLASSLDLGMLDLYLTGLLGFVHAVALVGADGVPGTRFLPFAQRMVEVLGASLADVARDVDAGTYPGTEDTLAMELAVLDHIVDASRARHLDPALVGLMRDMARRAVDDGYGHESFSRLVEVLRRPGPAGRGAVTQP